MKDKLDILSRMVANQVKKDYIEDMLETTDMMNEDDIEEFYDMEVREWVEYALEKLSFRTPSFKAKIYKDDWFFRQEDGRYYSENSMRYYDEIEELKK